MLYITVPGRDLWDETNNLFISIHEQKLQLEHSLISLSKWESKWCKPFLSKEEKTDEEIIDYIRCMTINSNVPPETYLALTAENLRAVNSYINAPMTATTITDRSAGRQSRQTITSELIYYWMISLNIPSEYQKWHLNRLLTLIQVCNIKNQPEKKRPRDEVLRENAALNAKRRAMLNSKG